MTAIRAGVANADIDDQTGKEPVVPLESASAVPCPAGRLGLVGGSERRRRLDRTGPATLTGRRWGRAAPEPHGQSRSLADSRNRQGCSQVARSLEARLHREVSPSRRAALVVAAQTMWLPAALSQTPSALAWSTPSQRRTVAADGQQTTLVRMALPLYPSGTDRGRQTASQRITGGLVSHWQEKACPVGVAGSQGGLFLVGDPVS
jgi:hypothetical protein